MTQTKETMIAALIAFAVCAALGPWMIPFLRRLKMGQTEREEGVASHLKKAGTPTMGGLMILAAVIVGSIPFLRGDEKGIPVLILTLGFGMIGFLDDYLKVVLHRSDGLIAWQKLLLQILVTGLFAFFAVKYAGSELLLRIPFSGGKMADIGVLAVPLLFFAVIGTVNGVNFTDGLDGLAASVTAVVAVFFLLAAVFLGKEPLPVGGAVFGALLGFMLYNAYPARIFMGDTGSLALGGFVAGMAYIYELPLFILLAGLVYLIEVLSVMIQVSYFKITHGKRIFKMAPIHHHFELCGWSETRIVAVFTAVTAVCCLIGLLAV
ncbi:MAG: phospho-N-acetylmuramoyl-pentapeptide-transferase [Blautia sp.]|nr:phospho-N-acetylmuramoyl-pentapeptide-transferase [Blautia sp.]